MCALYSYTDSFSQSDFGTGTFLEAYITSYTIGLECDSGDAYVNAVGGIRSESHKEEHNLANLFTKVISDVCSVFQIPVSTVLALFEGVAGGVDVTYDMYDTSMTVDLGINERVSFDNAPAPLDFGIYANGKDGPLSGVFTAYSEMTYGIDMMEAFFEVRTKMATVSNISV